MKDCRELPPVTVAISRIVAEALMGQSPASMEREVEAIVQEWRDEPGNDHGEFGWRLTTLWEEMANGIKAGEKALPPYAWLKPSVVARMNGMQQSLINARGILGRLRTQSLV